MLTHEHAERAGSSLGELVHPLDWERTREEWVANFWAAIWWAGVRAFSWPVKRLVATK